MSGGRRGKVARLVETELDGWGEKLERRWLGVDGERESLRDLADRFNEALLAERLAAAGDRPVDGEAANLRRLLDGEAGAGARTDAEARLRRAGVDPDELRSSFVSHRAVHSYLVDHRGVDPPGDDADPVETAREAVAELRGRTVAVADSKLDDLRSAGRIDLGRFDVLVDVDVICSDCGGRFAVEELLADGGCDCDGDGGGRRDV